MKKTYLGALLFVGTLAFTACQNETVVYVDENGNPIENAGLQEGEGLLEVAVSSTDAASRAVRPVGSSAAANNVSEVKVYAFKEDGGTYKFDKTLSLSNELSGVSCEGGIFTVTGLEPVGDHANTSMDNHTDQTKILILKGLVKGAKYKFVAVGYNDTYPYGTLPTPETINENTALTDFIQTAELESSDGSGVVGVPGIGDVEELFAGVSEEYETQADKAVFTRKASVTITRQVAGMLGYFEKVPTTIGDKVVRYVKVYANAITSTFKFPAQLLGTPDFNGVNSSEVEIPVMEFDMAAIATNWNGGTPTGNTYTFADCSMTGLNAGAEASSSAPLATGYKAPHGLKLKQGSIFGGRYLIPYSQHYTTQTLTVKLENANGDVLKTLKVVTDQKPANPANASKNAYDIRCNNFYSIGQKLDTDSTDGGTPDDPDEDKPIDLSGNTDIVVILNDAWKVLHNMGVEE